MQANAASRKVIARGTLRLDAAAAIPNQTRISKNVAWIRIGIPSIVPTWNDHGEPGGAATTFARSCGWLIGDDHRGRFGYRP